MELSVFIQSCYFCSLMFMNCSYIIIYYIGNLFLEDRSWNILKNSAIYAEMWITPSVPAIAYLKRISWILQLLVCVLIVAYQKKAGADRLIKKKCRFLHCFILLRAHHCVHGHLTIRHQVTGRSS